MKFWNILRAPGYRRSVFVRRVLAAVLLVVAATHAVLSKTADPLVVTFTSSVHAGTVLEATHVQLRRFPADSVPENALTDLHLATGHILAASASRGEIVTTTRLVGPDLARDLVEGETTGEPFSMVPVALAEPDIIPLLHHGATVNVITASNEDAQPVTIAHGGRVVLANSQEDSSGATVMLLLRESQAASVAAASLNTPLTVILSGAHGGVAP